MCERTPPFDGNARAVHSTLCEEHDNKEEEGEEEEASSGFTSRV